MTKLGHPGWSISFPQDLTGPCWLRNCCFIPSGSCAFLGSVRPGRHFLHSHFCPPALLLLSSSSFSLSFFSVLFSIPSLLCVSFEIPYLTSLRWSTGFCLGVACCWSPLVLQSAFLIGTLLLGWVSPLPWSFSSIFTGVVLTTHLLNYNESEHFFHL